MKAYYTVPFLIISRFFCGVVGEKCFARCIIRKACVVVVLNMFFVNCTLSYASEYAFHDIWKSFSKTFVFSRIDAEKNIILVSDDGVAIKKNGDGSFQYTCDTGYKYFSAVYFQEDGRSGWGGNEDGEIYYTNTNGDHWVKQQSLETHKIKNIFFLNDNKIGWAVGKLGEFQRTQDGGRHWELVNNSSFYERFGMKALYFLEDGLRGWVGGVQGYIFSTVDGGVKWDRVNCLISGQVVSIYFLQSGQVGWCGGSRGELFRTNNGGVTWEKCNIGGSKDRIMSIRSSADGSIVVAAGYNGNVFASNDGGISWNRWSMAGSWGFNTVSVSDDGNCAVVAGENGVALISTDHGHVWKSLLPSYYHFNKAKFSDDGNVSFAISGRGIYRGHGNGCSWGLAHDSKYWIYNNLFFDGNNFVAACGDGGLFSSSIDKGLSWSSHLIGKSDLIYVGFSNNTSGVVVNKDGDVLTSNDMGNTWALLCKTRMRNATAAFYSSVGKVVWVAGDIGGVVSVSSDGIMKHCNYGADRKITCIKFSPDGKHGVLLAESGDAFVSHDGGDSWVVKKVDHTCVLHDAYISVEGNEIDIVGNRGKIFTTLDGGDTWVSTIVTSEKDLDFIEMSSDLKNGWTGGKTGEFLRYYGRVFSPSISDFSVEYAGGKIIARWRVTHQDVLTVKCTGFYYTLSGSDERFKLDNSKVVSTQPGVFSFEWDPSENQLATGTKFGFVVKCGDGYNVTTNRFPDVIVYRPWWSRSVEVVGAWPCWAIVLLLSVLMVFLFHLILCFAYVFQPIFICCVYYAWSRVFLVNRGAGESGKTIYELCVFLLKIFLMDFWISRRRVLRSWVAFRGDQLVEHFVSEPQVAARRACFDLPIEITANGLSSTAYSVHEVYKSNLFPSLKNDSNRFVVQVNGVGGIGKSTVVFWLANEIGRMSLVKSKMSFCSLPVLFLNTKCNIFLSIIDSVDVATGMCLKKWERVLLPVLLRYKYINLIIDGMSEMSGVSDNSLSFLENDVYSVNALMVSSRIQYFRDRADAVCSLRPGGVNDAQGIDEFFNFYIRYKSLSIDTTFFFNAKNKLFELIRLNSILTPLLLRIFIDNIESLSRSDGNLEGVCLRAPEIIVQYASEKIPYDHKNDRVLFENCLKALRAFAHKCVGNDYIPRAICVDVTVDRLDMMTSQEMSSKLMNVLLDSGILIKMSDSGGVEKYAFEYDPFAEYFAAMYVLIKYKEDKNGLEDYYKGLCATVDAINGYRVAFSSCYFAYRVDWRLPVIDIDPVVQ